MELNDKEIVVAPKSLTGDLLADAKFVERTKWVDVAKGGLDGHRYEGRDWGHSREKFVVGVDMNLPDGQSFFMKAGNPLVEMLKDKQAELLQKRSKLEHEACKRAQIEEEYEKNLSAIKSNIRMDYPSAVRLNGIDSLNLEIPEDVKDFVQGNHELFSEDIQRGAVFVSTKFTYPECVGRDDIEVIASIEIPENDLEYNMGSWKSPEFAKLGTSVDFVYKEHAGVVAYITVFEKDDDDIEVISEGDGFTSGAFDFL